MRDTFFPYFLFNESNLNEIWNNAYIVIDANVLLNAYKMNSEAREQFFEVLKFKNITEKVWMPYQVGWEFLKNRKTVIDSTIYSLPDVRRELKKRIDGLKSHVEKSGLRFHEDFLNEFTNNVNNFRIQINELFDNYNKTERESDYYYQGKLNESDLIADMISDIYKDKIGDRFSQESLINFYKVGQLRFNLLIPPGFEDVNKGDYRTYGDFIIWEEMKKKAVDEKKPIIFVTEDHKKDWWLDEHKDNLKPQPHLLAEFKEETKQYFYMYTYKEFIKEAKTRYKELPDTDKVTKQMDLAAEDTVSNQELKQDKTIPDNDSYMFHLQNLMNSGNSAVAQRAYKENLQRLNILQNIYNQVMVKISTLSYHNPAKATEANNMIENAYNRSDISDPNKIEIINSVSKIIDDDIAFYERQGY